ncbi:penicillin-binding protein 2 [Candidatus Microgenomates bacterium]|nr:penicillin-binding protein 2 [Candidatus Microgenomates bacterium]
MRRLNFLFFAFLFFALLVIYRLFGWQIKSGERLAILAESQHASKIELPAQRGKILTADNFPLVDNQEAYLIYVDLTKISEETSGIAAKLAPFLSDNVATSSAKEELRLLKNAEVKLKKRLDNPDLVWADLKHKVKKEIKEEIEELNIAGIGFEKENIRFYPEASLSAHLLGFVGSDEGGGDKGYFGVEGYYDLELKGRPGLLYQEKDARGKPILMGRFEREEACDGRNLILHLDRAVQFMTEKGLREGIEKYGAKSGSIVIMEPQSGAILAMISFPSYEQGNFQNYDKVFYKNPVVTESFEPGSVFKIITMAAALDEGVIEPETRCDKCAGPRKIGSYVIHTYDDKYRPDSTMKEILEHSDNVGMVFIAEKLGKENFLRYVRKFGFSNLTGIDLEEEATPELRSDKEWREIDLAAASFGQGIAVTSIQMIRAAAVIANDGKLVVPRVVARVVDGEREVEIKPEVTDRVIKPETAKTLTEMMVSAVENGFPHWEKYGISGFRIAGKTGTAQIPIAGHYDEKKTIVSFVGFAPAEKPKFVMLVTLAEPTSSPWGANTAAPLWFDIAKELFLYYGISPKE